MHCYDISLSGGASVTGDSDLKNARKVAALASFYATAIQALIMTMCLELTVLVTPRYLYFGAKEDSFVGV